MRIVNVKHVSNAEQLKKVLAEPELNKCLMKGVNVEKPVVLNLALCEKLIFENVVFESDVWIEDINNPKLEILFKNCTFHNALFIQKSIFLKVDFNDCNINQGKIFDVRVQELFHFYDSKVGVLNIVSLQAKTVTIIKNKSGVLRFYSPRLELLEVDANESAFELNITHEEDENFKVGYHPFITSLGINYRSDYSGNISFSNIEVDTLELYGRLNNCQLIFADIMFRNISFIDFINNGILKFTQLKFKYGSSLRINNSDLGKTVVFGLDFNEFESIIVKNSNIQNLVYSGIVWCNIVKSNTGEMRVDDYKELYKQLKNVCSIQGDKPQELKYYSYEMDNYYLQLRENWKKNFNDFLIVGFNKYSNQHGLNWFRPLLIILGLIIVLYFPIKCLLGFNKADLSYSFSNISEMLECINPIRKFSDSYGISELNEKNKAYYSAKIIDFLLRILIGLFLFQTIKSFRKYVR